VPILTVRASEPLPEGTYNARIFSVDEYPDSKFGKDTLRLVFEITDSNHSGKRLSKIVSATVSSRSKLGVWIGRLSKEALRPGNQFNTDSLIGRDVKLAVTQQKRPDGSVLNLVADVFAA